MNPKTMEAVRREMQSLAMVDERFQIVYDFFRELGTANRRKFIIICRARMPFVAQKLVEAMPHLGDTTLVQNMKGVHYLSDEQIVQVSAVFLRSIVESVQQAIEHRA